MKEKLNGDTEEGCDRLSDEFSKSHKPRRKDLSNGDIDEHEKKSKRVSSLNSYTHKSSDNKLEETLTREQKEGAFSNFPISEETIKLLKGTMNFNAYAIENLKLDFRKLLYLF